jgi:dTDP-4-dehydrorhamnose reductase
MRTMLRVGAEREELRVVADQIGTPTPAWLIADVTMQVITRAPRTSGIYHLTARGQTSWHGFATRIFEDAHRKGLLARQPRVLPIATADYPTPARRPGYSCLDTEALRRSFEVVLPDWEQGLVRVLGALSSLDR